MNVEQKPKIALSEDIRDRTTWIERLQGKVEITEGSRVEGTVTEALLEKTEEVEWDHFWTKVFTLHRMRRTLYEGSKRELFDFQSHHKYLLMAYSPGIQKQLGRLLARGKEVPFYELAEEYSQLLEKALNRIPTKERHINACQHIAGHVKRKMTEEEKELLQSELEQYLADERSLQDIRALLREWAHKYGDDYIAKQAYLKPHPFVSM
ncbi:YbgA family protein [Salimicrobium sp. PL1-032A]|uniref:YbgA family protein n=1 Tax=Salimicrobium sp. PL1-032A TaxID=3095364 RepID=UPI00326021F9